VAKALASLAPPGSTRSSGGSILDPYKPKIHALLAEDPKLRAVRIRELIQLEGYAGQIGLVRNFVREIRSLYQPQRVFLRMEYEPGEYAQVDWAEMPDRVLPRGC
jgi:transposase